MSILLDAGLLFAALHERDEHHDRGRGIVAACMDGRYGRVLTSDYLVDELLTLVQARTAPVEMAQAAAARVGLHSGEPQLATSLQITPILRSEAWRLFQRYYDRGLSFTDCTTLVLMERERIDALATFDTGFQGLVPVVPEPGEG